MNKAPTSILVFGIYVVATGLTLLFVPNILLGLFTLPEASEVWIRVLGVLAFCLGLYYIQASRENNQAFFAMTIWGRVIFAVAIIALGILTPDHLPLILFALVDLVGAGWTWYALGQQAKLHIPATA